MNPNKDSSSEASLHAVDYWQVLRNRYGIILLTFLLAFLCAAVITSVLPKKYASTALLQVNPPTENDIGALQTRQFFMTQFDIIVASNNLRHVVDKLDLKTSWGRDEDSAIGLLKGMIDTKQRPGTDLIEITVEHQQPEMARAIAAQVAEAYKENRNNEELDFAQSQLNALEKEIRDQEDEVEQKRKVLDTIVKITGRPYIENSRYGVDDLERTDVRYTQQQLLELQSQKTQYKIYLENLEKFDSERLLSYAAEIPIADQTVQTQRAKYLEMQQQLASLKASGLGARHPQVQMQQDQLSAVRQDLESAVASMIDTMRTTYQMVTDRLEGMENMKEEKAQELADLSIDIQDFENAEREYEDALSLLQQLKLKHSSDKVLLQSPKKPITIREDPKENNNPVSPKVTLYLTLGAVLGLVFGIAIAFFLEYIDTSVKSLEDVERFLQVPVLAVIPKDVGVLHKQSGMSPDAEAYRILRTNIEFNRKNPEDNSITVVSGGAGEGKSTTLVNLAYVCAQGGYTTLMIDADLRRPRLHTFFDINNSVGLTNYLTTDLMLEDVILQTPVDNLYFMPSGVLPADAAGILNSRRMSELIQDVKQRFDLVLVDSPPILGVSDASVLASEVDLTMIVVQHRKLPRNMLMRVKQAVENVGGHVIGVVLNNVDIRSDNQYQYYTSYYTYYAPSSEPEPRAAKKKAEKAKPAPKAASSSSDSKSDLY
ncbi:MAG: polysaccharide biosynthesis tyrosine autokinase [Verrucomicrobiota bacterium JB023]|nr:polysaccharide biosynthesis tyrosine autokinase [Verrucomicrobiota bacterium JB023]